MSLRAAREAAARGAEVLSKYDMEWYECIDLDHLQLSSSWSCVLGQYGEANLCDDDYSSPSPYSKMLSRLPLGVDLAPGHYGFDASSALDPERRISYGELTKAWKEIILYLQEVGGV